MEDMAVPASLLDMFTGLVNAEEMRLEGG